MNYQAAIVGGGPAGLQAALTLGRMHVNTIIFDDARYRNARSSMMGNVLGWDGRDPAALRAASRSELEKYPWVAVVNERVQSARQAGDHFVLTTTASELSCERLLLACGVEDRLLPIPGVHELWGELVLPCPYCHGHEFAAGSVAVVSDGSHAEHVSSLLRKISTTVPVVAPAQVNRVERTPAGVRLLLHDGEPIDAGCVFIPPNPAPRSSLATDLGLQLTQNGVEVDELGRTSKFGVWAAGDVARRAHPQIPAAVVTAMAAGLTAAADIAAAAAHGKETPK